MVTVGGWLGLSVGASAGMKGVWLVWRMGRLVVMVWATRRRESPKDPGLQLSTAPQGRRV